MGAGVCQTHRAARAEGSPHGANSHAHQDLHQSEGLWLSRLRHPGHTQLILSEPPLIALIHTQYCQKKCFPSNRARHESWLL